MLTRWPCTSASRICTRADLSELAARLPDLPAGDPAPADVGGARQAAKTRHAERAKRAEIYPCYAEPADSAGYAEVNARLVAAHDRPVVGRRPQRREQF